MHLHTNSTRVSMPSSPSITDDIHVRQIQEATKRVSALTEYHVVAPKVPFYKENDKGCHVLRTAEDRRDGDCEVARYGDIFTGFLVFTKNQAYVNLGFNTFLPLTDVVNGDILLKTRSKRTHRKRKR